MVAGEGGDGQPDAVPRKGHVFRLLLCELRAPGPSRGRPTILLLLRARSGRGRSGGRRRGRGRRWRGRGTLHPDLGDRDGVAGCRACVEWESEAEATAGRQVR